MNTHGLKIMTENCLYVAMSKKDSIKKRKIYIPSRTPASLKQSDVILIYSSIINKIFQGMRIVKTPSDFLSNLESARRESLRAFGDEAVLLERYSMCII